MGLGDGKPKRFSANVWPAKSNTASPVSSNAFFMAIIWCLSAATVPTLRK
jgi:hypothetical protein